MTSSSTQLPLALRNAAILGWFTDCSDAFRAKVCGEYALTLGCPPDEIDPDMIWPGDLDWLWARYGATINLWTEEQL